MNPPCSKWQVWSGVEVEGQSQRGEPTLFIRAIPPEWNPLHWQRVTKNKDGSLKFKRVWFCAEFTDWEHVRFAMRTIPTVCVEVKAIDAWPPADILKNAVIYLKLPLTLKPGDHVCVGQPFEDEAFMIGTGQKVGNGDYLQDVFIA